MAVPGLGCSSKDFLVVACGTLVLWTGIKPRPLALGAWSLSHWTAREVPEGFSSQEWAEVSYLDEPCILVVHEVLGACMSRGILLDSCPFTGARDGAWWACAFLIFLSNRAFYLLIPGPSFAASVLVNVALSVSCSCVFRGPAWETSFASGEFYLASSSMSIFKKREGKERRTWSNWIRASNQCKEVKETRGELESRYFGSCVVLCVRVLIYVLILFLSKYMAVYPIEMPWNGI